MLICNLDIYNNFRTIDHGQIGISNEAEQQKKILIRIVKAGLISLVIPAIYMVLYDFNPYPLIFQSIAILCFYFLWKSHNTTISHHAVIIWFNMLIALGLNQFANIVEIYLFLIIIGLEFFEKTQVRTYTENNSLKYSLYSACAVLSVKIFILYLNYGFILFLIPFISSIFLDLIIFRALLKKSNQIAQRTLNKMQNFSLGFIIIAIFIFQL